MRARRSTVAALTLVALGLSACGSSSSSGDKSTPVTVSTPAGGAAVTYENFAASPKTVTVKLGASVTWTNKDPVEHNVVSTAGPTGDKISSPAFSQNGTFTFTPSVVGTVNYVCTFHSQMTGYTVVVTS